MVHSKTNKLIRHLAAREIIYRSLVQTLTHASSLFLSLVVHARLVVARIRIMGVQAITLMSRSRSPRASL